MAHLKLIFLLIALPYLALEISGHGMMLEPPNRSSLWRFDGTSPVNLDDNQNWCGGPLIEWNDMNGKCGVCGDIYDAPHPQDNENGGKYGKGVVVRTYGKGDIIDTTILLTINHMGTYKYSICVLDDPDAPESGDDCFVPLKLADGSSEYKIDPNETTIRNKVQLPEDLTCERCTLRWDWLGADMSGDCGNGTIAQGCGHQETFRSCSDIAIV